MKSTIFLKNLRSHVENSTLTIGEAPQLSWQIDTHRKNFTQTAYQITAVANQPEFSQPPLWDSGKVISKQSQHILYTGPALTSRQRVYWRVRIWDEADHPSNWSKPAWWEMGLLEKSDWQAEWIGGYLAGGRRTAVPVPKLQKRFSLEKEVTSARLYITALGIYEAELNGRPLANDVFAPGWTDYNKRVRYQAYDVTSLLRVGTNELNVLLGDGWYCGHLEWRGRQLYGDRPRLLAQLEVTLADETAVIIPTDSSWQVAYGPILEADLIMGESWDARRSWDNWQPALTFPAANISLDATASPLPSRQEELPAICDPTEIPAWPASTWVYDFGQNLVGRVRLKIKGKAGTTITLKHGEMLNPDGTLYTANLRTAKQTDHYTLAGDGEEIWEPKFTFHGFRYAELIGYEGTPPRDLLTAIVIHSDLPTSGHFECSDPLINQLQSNIRWGQKGNFVDLPTDCPQRDERLGWLGDSQVFVKTAVFNMNAAGFYAKHLQDIADAQLENGLIPSYAPTTPMLAQKDGGPAWSDAVVIIPWTIYQQYGNPQILADAYPTMCKFVDFLTTNSPNFIRGEPVSDNPEEVWLTGGYGDWLAQDGSGKKWGGTPKDLIGTAFMAHSAALLSQIAVVLGHEHDAQKYRMVHEQTRQAFINRYLTPEGLIVGQTQTAMVLALQFDLVPNALRPVMTQNLVQDIVERGMHLSTGFVGTPYINHVLTQNGRSDIAFKLLQQKSYPSWLYAVTNGATTIWERWDGWTEENGFQDPGMNSFNHYAYGAIGDWLYRVVAGINPDPNCPGFQRILLQPHVGGGVTWVKAHYDSGYGRITSEWQLQESQFIYDITIPPNTSATVTIPAHTQPPSVPNTKFINWDGKTAVYHTRSGTYQFISQL